MAKLTRKQAGAKVAPKPSTENDAEKKSSTQRIFGAKVMDHGYTALPNILMRGQKRLGISTTQFNIVAQLMSYWFDPARPPFPSKRDLAQRMGITEQTLRINIKALEERGLVMREQWKTAAGDYGSNRYHLDGLVKALKKLEPDFDEERKERRQSTTLTEKPNARANARNTKGTTDGSPE
jgi:predicted transcriptional regulator